MRTKHITLVLIGGIFAILMLAGVPGAQAVTTPTNPVQKS